LRRLMSRCKPSLSRRNDCQASNVERPVAIGHSAGSAAAPSQHRIAAPTRAVATPRHVWRGVRIDIECQCVVLPAQCMFPPPMRLEYGTQRKAPAHGARWTGPGPRWSATPAPIQPQPRHRSAQAGVRLQRKALVGEVQR
jgi:hypothetical protein